MDVVLSAVLPTNIACYHRQVLQKCVTVITKNTIRTFISMFQTGKSHDFVLSFIEHLFYVLLLKAL